ncbi:MAG: ATP-binding protein [Thermoguttaceae bacterium]|jgi:PAS domain S-box-containing protein
MSAKLSFDDRRYQNSFIRFAQQLSGITDQEDTWCQIGQAIFHFFDADLVGFLELSENGHWKAHYWILPPDCTEEDVFTPALKQTASKVLESSFMACESLDLKGACQVAVFPLAVDNRRTAIMLIGHSVSTPIGKDLLDIYLGVAGLVGGTITRAGVLARLRQDNKSMHQIFAGNSGDARLRNIVENALEIIYTLSPEGMISYASPRWTQLIGHQSSDLLGRSFVSFLHPSDRAVFQSYFAAETAGDGQSRRIEFRIQNCDGSWRWYSTTLSTVKDSQGAPKEFVGIAEDITDRKQAEEELRKAKEAAEAATLAKTVFLTNISHEIRTPMTAILGFAEMLLESIERPQDIVAANTIKRNGEYLLRIINDILDLSTIETGHFVSEQAKCSPRELIEDVVSMMKVRADAKGLPLLVEFAGPIPQSIRTDPIRLRQILINLIGNAIKFTEEGHICIQMRFIQSEQNKPLLEYKIIDTGIGMSEDQINRLFEPFTQGDTTTSRKYVGMGLGLALSKRLAGMLGGDITFSSAKGKGSTFVFTLGTGSLEGVRMLQTSDMHEAETSSLAGLAPPVLPQMSGRILLVEDGLDNQRLLALILRKAGAKVTIVNNGKEALEKVIAEQKKYLAEGLQTSPFDVILMDMQMPEMDGYEATWRLREMGYSAPIIALTAHAMSHDREKCLGAGCDEYLTKPIDRDTLFSTVVRYMSDVRQSQQEAQAWII